ncbi:hypothetical protein AB1046_13785 [Promicromonospora sp. Populi]|uniref:hypothetical protein n=1 Tax=Promicromonospora sp. Populi TaxID=3239420 RepID=UPI0034E29972
MTDRKLRGAGQGVPRVAHPTPKGHPLQIMVRGRPLTAERIRRVERRARRAARARRRFIVSIVLLVGSVVAWAFAGFGQLHWGFAATSSGMLLFVLFLGQRAARAARRADARWQATVRAARQRATQARALSNGGPYAPRNRAQVTGLATRGSNTQTQAIPRVGGRDVLDEILDGPSKPKVIEVPAEAPQVEQEEAAKQDEFPNGRAWDPVPVPLPTYVTKAAAPQRQPAALPPSIPPSIKGPTTAGGSGAVSAPSGSEPVADESLQGEPPRTKSETLAKPLEEILARRRAAG